MERARAGFLTNPLIERDFFGFCRKKRWFTTRTVFVGGIVLCVLLFFLHAADEIRVGNLDAVGRNLFAAAAVTSVVLLVLTIPALTADIVSRERRLGSLDVLLSTPLSPTAVILGKLAPRMALLFVLVAGSFPPIVITLFFGGVRGEQVTGLFLLSLGIVVSLAPLSVLISTLTTRPAGAVLTSYLLALVPAGGMALLPGSGLPALSWLSAVRLLAAPPLGTSPDYLMSAAVGQLLFGTAVGATSVVLAIWRLRWERRIGAVSTGRTRSARSVARRASAFDRKNPLIPRESRILTGGIGHGPWWLVLFILLAAEGAMLLGPKSWTVGFGPAGHGAVVMAEGFLILIFAALAGATSVIADRERGIMDQLQLSRLAPRDVVVGKTVGTFRAMALLLAVPLFHLLMVGSASLATAVGAILYVVIAGCLVLLATMLGVTNSIRARTVPQAIRHCLWHLSWFTVTFPLLNVVLTILLEGQVAGIDRTSFSLLVPLQLTGEAAAGGDLAVLGSFFSIFYLVLTGFLLAVLALHFLPAWAGNDAAVGRTDRLTGVADWRESWKKLSAEWEAPKR